MSQLEDLIQTLFPDGVEFVKLGEIAPPKRGVRVVRSQLARQGGYPVYQNSMTPLGFFEASNSPANTVFIISAGAAGDIGYSLVDFWAADDCFYFSCPQQLLSRFLYYVLISQQDYLFSRVRRASVPRLSRSVIEGVKIPIPPLPVQEEIVRILDTFNNVVVELEAELDARVRQYEQYRFNLLSFQSESNDKMNSSSIVKIKDVARRNHGTNITAERMRIINKPNGAVRIFAGGSTIADVDYDDIPRRDIICETSIIVKSRGYIGFEYYEKPFSHKNEFWSYTFSKECNTKFVYYYLLTKTGYFQQKAKSSSVKLPQLTVADTDDFMIPLPPLSLQQEIVGILDTFANLVNDLKSGLPAEIALRRKQYEYYRDKLLTFKEKPA